MTTTDIFELPPVAHMVADLDDDFFGNQPLVAMSQELRAAVVSRSLPQAVARSLAVAVGTLAALGVGVLTARGMRW